MGSARRFFSAVPPQLDNVVFLNHEACPANDTVVDWFTEVSAFKVNSACDGQERFVAYSHGKSAVRLADGVQPSGSHRFSSIEPARKVLSRWVTPCRTECAESVGENTIVVGGFGDGKLSPCLLHYVNCGFEEWRRKYQSLGKFPDVYCGDTAIPFEFHLKSRDLVCGGGGAEADEALRAHYRASMVYEADRVDEGISKGNLIRSDAVATAATEALEMALRNSEALAEELANQ